MYILERTGPDAMRFTVVNTKQRGGIDYHPASASQPGKIKRKTCFVIENANRDRLLDSSFWFFLLRINIWPPEDKVSPARLVYETLLPFLNEVPTATNIEVTIQGLTQSWTCFAL